MATATVVRTAGVSTQFATPTPTTLATELTRYDDLRHLRTQAVEQGYHQQNPLGTEVPSCCAVRPARTDPDRGTRSP